MVGVWRIVCWVLLAATLVLFALGSRWYGPHLGWGLTGLYLAYVSVLAIVSAYGWKPKLDFIEKYIAIDHWNRFSSFRSDDRLAEIMQQNMTQIIREQRHP